MRVSRASPVPRVHRILLCRQRTFEKSDTHSLTHIHTLTPSLTHTHTLTHTLTQCLPAWQEEFCYTFEDNYKSCRDACPQVLGAFVEDQANPDAKTDRCIEDVLILETERGEAIVSGPWRTATAGQNFHGSNYIHNDFNTDAGTSALFPAKFLGGGSYWVYISYSQDTSRSTNVAVQVRHQGGVAVEYVDQTAPPSNGTWHLVGKYPFEGTEDEGVVVMAEAGQRNRLITADSVKFERAPCETTQEPTTEDEPVRCGV
jgi:hypothetical protein